MREKDGVREIAWVRENAKNRKMAGVREIAVAREKDGVRGEREGWGERELG